MTDNESSWSQKFLDVLQFSLAVGKPFKHRYGMEWEYKASHTFQQRTLFAMAAKKINPDYVPIVLERSPSASPLVPPLHKSMQLVNKSWSFTKFYVVIREKLGIDPEEELYFFIHAEIPELDSKVRDQHEDNKERDGILYVAYSNTPESGDVRFTREAVCGSHINMGKRA